MLASGFSHPKFKLAARDLGITLCHMRGIVESIWHVTRTHFPAGDIGGYSNEEILVAIDEDLDADTLIGVLIHRRILDERPDLGVRLYVHDWHHHCDDHTRERLRSRKQTFANGEPPYCQRRSDRAEAAPEPLPEAVQKIPENPGNPRKIPEIPGKSRKSPENPSRAKPVPVPAPEPGPVPAAAPAPEPPARAREKPPPDPPPPPPQFSSRVPQDLEARLVETGVSPEQLADVIAAPGGVQIIELQLEWLPLRGSVTNPAGMLVAACRGAADGDPRWTTAPAKARARAAQEARATQAAARLTRLQASQDAQRLTPIQRRLDALPEPLREEWRAMVRRASPWLGGLLAAAAPDPHPDRLVVLTLSRTACQALTGHRDEIERLAGRPVSVTVIDTAAEEAA